MINTKTIIINNIEISGDDKANYVFEDELF